MKIKTLLLGAALLMAGALYAQSQQEMINQARAMGVSESQIQAALASQNEPAGGSSPKSMGGATTSGARVDTVNMNFKPEIEELKLDSIVFGREIFRDRKLSFSPSLNSPTPKSYVLGAGDEVRINIWGNSELDFSQEITPEGRIFIDELGPIQLSGLTIAEAEAKVKRELSKLYRGLEDGTNTIALSLGQIRSIKVNIVGEAFSPGTYVMPSFGTLFNALYMAGGVNSIGSLRSIKVYNNNKLKADLDVYDYLLNGKSNTNIRLEDGDMILVSPYDNLVVAKGELKRKRIYELKSDESLGDLLSMAGSFTGSAYKQSVQVNRTDGEFHSVKRVTPANFDSFSMMDGDTVYVHQIAKRFNNKLEIEGAVWYPGQYELSGDVTSVKSLVESAGGLKGDEFAGRAFITRVMPDFTEKVIALDIKGIVNGTVGDVELQRDDKLFIPSLFDLREEFTIMVKGAVNNPIDTMAYRKNMSVEDAIILAGGLTEAASKVNVSVARRVKDPRSTSTPDRIVETFDLTLNKGLKIADSGAPLILQPFDEVLVRFSPGYREQETISIGGEVLFKGDYVLESVDSRLSDVLRKAGGVTDFAYVKGASLKRQLSEEEMKRVETIVNMSSNDQMQDSISMETINIKDYSVGIDLEKALKNPGSHYDIVLRKGDVLYVPKAQSTVKISGAVVYSNSTSYIAGMNVKDYVNQAGGYADAAKKRPVVIYMNGQVATTKRVFFFKKYPKVEPGCEVLVAARRKRDKGSLAEILAIANSTTSMAAMVTAMMK